MKEISLFCSQTWNEESISGQRQPQTRSEMESCGFITVGLLVVARDVHCYAEVFKIQFR